MRGTINNTLMMDEYELTMANAYYTDPDMRHRKAAFSVFFRRVPENGAYAIFAGLEQVIEYLRNMRFDTDDIQYLETQHKYDPEFIDYLRTFKFEGAVEFVPEGTIVYPNTPLITLIAELPAAQLAETAILAQINHQSLIATKTSRIIRAANGRPVSDFGARRAHNNDAAIYGARAAYIAGVASTATVLAGKLFNIPIGGTMAHSWVMAHKDELTAFRKFAHKYPHHATLLIDTYDVIEGAKNAITVFNEMKTECPDFGPYGVRIDSGDLAQLSQKVRQLLDDAGHKDAKIVVSNSLDEHTIESLFTQNAAIDAFGVGERLITASAEPVFGAVYKLVAIDNDDGNLQPVIKISENVEKITNPGITRLWRAHLKNSDTPVDIVSDINPKNQNTDIVRVVDPKRPWKIIHVEPNSITPLTHTLFITTKNRWQPPTITQTRKYCLDNLDALPQGEKRFDNPQEHLVCMTPTYYEKKMDMLNQYHLKK